MKYLFLPLALVVSSCSLLSPGDVVNPNVDEGDFLASPGAMSMWHNGLKARTAVGVACLSELSGLLSDDMLNTSSRSSKNYDRLDILYTDYEVKTLSTYIGEMLQMSAFGLNAVAQADKAATQSQRFDMAIVQALAHLVAGENFVALPREAGGPLHTSQELLADALADLNVAETLAASPADKALVALLRARASRALGRRAEAQAFARQSLTHSEQLTYSVSFDAMNGFANSVQEYVATDLFRVLPRLSALRVKCPAAADFNQPICVAKSEEAYLICAEAALSQSLPDDARASLADLLTLISAREDKVTPCTVVAADIAAATTPAELLALVYRLRQEVFFAEGRRASDLGLRLPLSEVECKAYGAAADTYRTAVRPDWLLEAASRYTNGLDDEALDLNALLASHPEALPFGF